MASSSSAMWTSSFSVLIALVLTLSTASAWITSDYADDSSNSVYDNEDVSDMVETGRLAYVTIGNNGIVVTVNKTSIVLGTIKTILLLGLAAAVAAGIAAAIAIPLGVAIPLGKKHKNGDEDYEYYSGGGGYGSSGGGYGASGGGSSYSSYAKRSLEVMSPIMNALYSAYQKYSGDDEEKPAL
ncbi:uncharacterized protein LOC108674481 [Hyalella azteca]|uniref:Uncharacterized protein LOC108674481 n=1 Tax=Hyalella azteca TaxID=294128 RepID=A0A8B7NW31_HYAAZ|nr:uncharacterized protein LOC108674481 [Hyalella azteca]